jgi:hypothetical protein
LTDWRSIGLFWIGYVFLSVNQSFAWNVVADRGRAWHEPIPWALATAVVWGTLTPFIVRWSRKHRIDRTTWKRNLPWHIGLIPIIGLIDAGADQFARMAGNMEFGFWADYFRKLDIVTFYYGIIAGVTHAVDYYRMYRHGELRATQLEGELRQSQLEILKSQLQPHFLFNTLNAVNALIYEDPKAADRVLTRLGELLRMALAVGSAQEVTLGYELEFVRAYLDIQQTRLAERLRVVIDVPEGLYDAMVPTLLLQPLVENAVRHGIAPLVRGGSVTIRARAQGNDIILQVLDDGAGFNQSPRRGIGLANVQQRLHHLYGDDHRFAIEQNGSQGTRVDIALPVKRGRDHRPDLLVEQTAV